ncbi:hypothetical protein ABVQ21_002858 [Listeria monocytogenes]
MKKAWFKEVPTPQVQVEVNYLKRFFQANEYQVEIIETILFSVMYYVSLRNRRIHREILKERGYYYEAYNLGDSPGIRLSLRLLGKPSNRCLLDYLRTKLFVNTGQSPLKKWFLYLPGLATKQTKKD